MIYHSYHRFGYSDDDANRGLVLADEVPPASNSTCLCVMMLMMMIVTVVHNHDDNHNNSDLMEVYLVTHPSLLVTFGYAVGLRLTLINSRKGQLFLQSNNEDRESPCPYKEIGSNKGEGGGEDE
jgi:Ca2+/H+ antiporter